MAFLTMHILNSFLFVILEGLHVSSFLDVAGVASEH